MLNDMVSRILSEMFRFSLFNNPPTGTTSAIVTTPAHQAVSTAVAEAGTVLLKNSSGTLPLSASDGGTRRGDRPGRVGGADHTGGGSAFVTPPFNVTPLQGIQSAAGPGTTVYTRRACPRTRPCADPDRRPDARPTRPPGTAGATPAR